MDTAFVSSASLCQEGSSILSHDQTIVKMIIIQIHGALRQWLMEQVHVNLYSDAYALKISISFI